MPKVPEEKDPRVLPRNDIDPYLHTEHKHKNWYNRKAMGNLGDKRGYLSQESKREKLKRIFKKLKKRFNK